MLAVPIDDLDADIVQAHGRPVFGAGDHRDLELARQVTELGVKTAPLADQFGPGTRVGDFVRGGTRKLIRRDVADTIAAGLDRVHLDTRQIG